MAKSSFTIDTRELDKYLKDLKIAQKDYNDFLASFLLKEADEVVELAKEKTPVDTGALKDSWNVVTSKGSSYHIERRYGQHSRRWYNKKIYDYKGVKNIRGTGKSVEVDVENNQDYATQVEYGGPNNEASYMLTKAIDQVQSNSRNDYNFEFERFKKEHNL